MKTTKKIREGTLLFFFTTASALPPAYSYDYSECYEYRGRMKYYPSSSEEKMMKLAEERFLRLQTNKEFQQEVVSIRERYSIEVSKIRFAIEDFYSAYQKWDEMVISRICSKSPKTKNSKLTSSEKFFSATTERDPITDKLLNKVLETEATLEKYVRLIPKEEIENLIKVYKLDGWFFCMVSYALTDEFYPGLAMLTRITHSLNKNEFGEMRINLNMPIDVTNAEIKNYLPVIESAQESMKVRKRDRPSKMRKLDELILDCIKRNPKVKTSEILKSIEFRQLEIEHIENSPSSTKVLDKDPFSPMALAQRFSRIKKGIHKI